MDTHLNGTPANVLLTGATSGIGHEIGRLLAAQGHRLLIVGRQESTLRETADAFRDEGATQVEVIPVDLSLPGGANRVREATDALGLPIDILVNDAGRGVHGAFIDTPLEEELALMHLNMQSLVHLTKLYVRDMVQRGRGRVLQVASIASYQPTPLLAVYAATKSFVLSFSEALADELKGTGVTVTVLIPGATDTDFFRKAGMEHTRAAQETEDPARVARIAVERLFKGERHAVAPGVTQQIVMSSVMPNDRVAAMAHKQMLPAEDGRE